MMILNLNSSKRSIFIFYFYPESEEAVKDAARMAERWYERHSMVFSS